MSMIRVAFVNMRPRLRDILTDAVAKESDMELVQWRAAIDVEQAACRPNVVVCEAEDPLDATAPSQLLRLVPGARVLMIADTGENGVLYELRPARRMLPGVSVTQVIHAIRFGLDQH